MIIGEAILTIKKLNKQKFLLPNSLNWSPYTRNQKFFQLLPSNQKAIRVCWSIWWWIDWKNTRQHACLTECWHVGLPSWQLVLSTKYKTDVRCRLLSLLWRKERAHAKRSTQTSVVSSTNFFDWKTPHVWFFINNKCQNIWWLKYLHFYQFLI